MAHSNSEKMDTTTKKKLKIVLIAFIIILIPLGYGMKIMYGMYLYDRALDTYWGSHIGMSDDEAAREAITQFDKAKKFYKRNKVIYINQARLFGHINQYDKAIKTIEEYLEIKPNFAYGHLMLGVFNELQNETEKSHECYLEFISLQAENYSEKKLDSQELKNMKVQKLIDYYLLNDTVSFKSTLIELEKEYPDDLSINGVKNWFKSENRKEIILEYIGIATPHNIGS